MNRFVCDVCSFVNFFVMFVNLCFCEFPCPTDKAGHLANVRPVVLPNSSREVLSKALVFSTSPPVSVCGTGPSIPEER